jgi:hypothetical protein
LTLLLAVLRCDLVLCSDRRDDSAEEEGAGDSVRTEVLLVDSLVVEAMVSVPESL